MNAAELRRQRGRWNAIADRDQAVERVCGADLQVLVRGDIDCTPSAWRNKRGRGGGSYDQGTGGNQPAKIAADTDFGRQPCLNFDGTDDVLLRADGPALATGDSSWGVVLRSDTADATERWIAECGSGRFGMCWTRSLANKHYLFNNAGGVQFTSSSPEANVTQDLMFVLDTAAQTVRLLESGSDRGTVADTGSEDVDGAMSIGAIYAGAVNCFDGRIAEHWVASRALLGPERGRIRDHHRRRYGYAP